MQVLKGRLWLKVCDPYEPTGVMVDDVDLAEHIRDFIPITRERVDLNDGTPMPHRGFKQDVVGEAVITIRVGKEAADPRPICLDCGEMMVKAHYQMEDGWHTFWMCGCKVPAEVQQASKSLAEMLEQIHMQTTDGCQG